MKSFGQCEEQNIDLYRVECICYLPSLLICYLCRLLFRTMLRFMEMYKRDKNNCFLKYVFTIALLHFCCKTLPWAIINQHIYNAAYYLQICIAIHHLYLMQPKSAPILSRLCYKPLFPKILIAICQLVALSGIKCQNYWHFCKLAQVMVDAIKTQNIYFPKVNMSYKIAIDIHL